MTFKKRTAVLADVHGCNFALSFPTKFGSQGSDFFSFLVRFLVTCPIFGGHSPTFNFQMTILVSHGFDVHVLIMVPVLWWRREVKNISYVWKGKKARDVNLFLLNRTHVDTLGTTWRYHFFHFHFYCWPVTAHSTLFSVQTSQHLIFKQNCPF